MIPPVLPVVLCALLLAAPAGASRHEVVVFAAASLADALNEIGPAYAAAGGARVVFNFAGSNALSRQIAAGAPAEVFLSADRAQVELLEKAGRVRRPDTVALLGNSLVVVVPADSGVRPLAGADGLLAFDRLALADPAAVPAGVYARSWLEKEGLWRRLADRVVPALDVRAALAAVASGNLPAGIVYATDATSSPRVRVIYRVPQARAPTVRYFAAPVVQDGSTSRQAVKLIAFLQGEKAHAIFSRYGFTPLPTAPPR
jgi:molybdate transport system substrate-binding protein